MSSQKLPKSVVVHPLVLLSVVDHYNRIAADTKNRVVGVLLGSEHNGVVDVTNSFAVPFEEDPKDPSIWFLDHNFIENMSGMFRKVNAREIIVGWYSTGPKLKKSDIEIHEVFRQYIPHPVYVIINVKPKDIGIPIESYVAVEEAQDEKSQPKLTFAHVPSEVGALEAEEIGVEHLLRDVKDTTVSDLATSVQSRMNAMQALKSRLEEINEYLQMVIDKKLPINHNILYILQDVFNLLPGLQTEETKMGFTTQTNDSMLAMYISSTVRSIIALHELINNKLDLRKFELEEKSEKKKEEKKEEKTKEKQEENAEEKKDVKKQSTD